MNNSLMCVVANRSDEVRIATQHAAMMRINASVSKSSSAFGSRPVFAQTVQRELAAWVSKSYSRRCTLQEVEDAEVINITVDG